MTLVLFLSALATSIHRSRRLCGCVLCCATAAPMEGLTLSECSHSLLPLNHRHLCFPGLAHILGVDCVDLLSSISHFLLRSNEQSPSSGSSELDAPPNSLLSSRQQLWIDSLFINLFILFIFSYIVRLFA